MKTKINYQEFYMDLQDEIIDLLTKDKEEGLMMKEICDRVKKKQEKEYFE